MLQQLLKLTLYLLYLNAKYPLYLKTHKYMTRYNSYSILLDPADKGWVRSFTQSLGFRDLHILSLFYSNILLIYDPKKCYTERLHNV